MNKKLLAIAVGAAMVAGATTAIAADEPTFYGKIHVSIDSMDNDAAAPNDEDGIFVTSNISRLGIKGSEDLGGGLSAIYQYEMFTDYATAGAVMGERNAFLGLKGGFGQVIAGRYDMPFKTIGRKHDLFSDTIGDTRALSRVKGDGDDWADRRDNLIMYTNTFGPIGLKVALGQEEATDKGADIGIGISYNQGPVNVMFVSETHGKGNLGNPVGTATKDSTGNALMGSYNMGNMQFLAGYSMISDVQGSAGSDYNLFTLGGAMKAGANTFKLQYTSGEVDCTGCTGTAATLIAVGADHKFTKNTKAYVAYAAIDNDANMDMSFSDTGHGATVAASPNDGDSPSGLSLGLIHTF